MFSKDITNTDKFLDLSLSAQAVYFHLGVNADDDGFVSNPRSIIRSMGATNKDAEQLVSEGFVIPFASGVVVITHWKENNFIRNDRYTPTIHQEELQQLTLVNNVYTLDNFNGIPLVYQGYTQDRLGKDRVGKETFSNKVAGGTTNKKEQEQAFDEFWQLYPRKVGKEAAKKKWLKLNPSCELKEKIFAAARAQSKQEQWTKDNGQFIPHPTTWLNQGRWDDVVEYTQRTVLDFTKLR